MKRRLTQALAVLLFTFGGWQVGAGVWIYAKAALAQVLIKHAWDEALAGHKAMRPWPWADTYPVARLAVPALGVDEIVLAGASGRTLAFGPGHMDGTAAAGAPGSHRHQRPPRHAFPLPTGGQARPDRHPHRPGGRRASLPRYRDARGRRRQDRARRVRRHIAAGARHLLSLRLAETGHPQALRGLRRGRAGCAPSAARRALRQRHVMSRHRHDHRNPQRFVITVRWPMYPIPDHRTCPDANAPQHLYPSAGIGAKKERALWKSGILTWDDYLRAYPTQEALFEGTSADRIQTELLSSAAALASGDMEYFAERLPKREHYRIALTVPDATAFLDIETTGLSFYYDKITVIGYTMDGDYHCYIQGTDRRLRLRALKRAKCLVTFNGTNFDLKFLRSEFPDLTLCPRPRGFEVSRSGGRFFGWPEIG